MDEKEKPSRPYVVIIEDDNFLRSLILQKFDLEGFEIAGAPNGREGIERITERRPDILLLDLLLPDINGFEVLEYIKENDSLHGIPILIVSNLGSAEDMGKAQKLGAEHFLIKANTSTMEIVEKVREILAGGK